MTVGALTGGSLVEEEAMNGQCVWFLHTRHGCWSIVVIASIRDHLVIVVDIEFGSSRKLYVIQAFLNACTINEVLIKNVSCTPLYYPLR